MINGQGENERRMQEIYYRAGKKFSWQETDDLCVGKKSERCRLHILFVDNQ